MLSTLQAEVPDLRLVVCSPVGTANADLVHGDPRIAFEPLAPYQPGPLGRAIDSIVSEKFLHSSRLQAVKLQRDRARLLRGRPTRPLLLRAKTAVSAVPIPRTAWYALAQRIEARGSYAELFDRFAPDLLVTSSAGFALAEVPLIFEAKRRGIPQMAIDLGWDNLSSKYHTILPVDRLTVWNATMRREAVRYHGFADEQVDVTGAPQFDTYFRDRARMSREAFFASVGADPGCRLVTLATTAAGSYGGTPSIVRALADAAQEGALGRPTQILVRLHPRDVRAAYADVGALPRVIVDTRVKRLESLDSPAEFDALTPEPSDRDHLAATLAYSDVLINFASTTTIEAFVFDTPVINIGFDPVVDAPLPLSIRRYFAYEHYRPVVQSGAVRIATSIDDLIEQARAYLADPSLDRPARARMVNEVCGFTDGRSGERVGLAVAKQARCSLRRQ